MPTFGHRPSASGPPPRRPPRQPLHLGAVPSALVVLVFLTLAVLAFRAWEATLPPPRDEAPGFRTDIGAYAPPKDCPIRAWSVGEYLPTACLKTSFSVYKGPQLGLSYIASSRSIIRRHSILWVRQFGDALGVMCPTFGPCLVETVVRDRFIGPPAQPTPGQQATDFSKPSTSYWVGYLFDILISAAPFAVMLFLFLNQRRTPRPTA